MLDFEKGNVQILISTTVIEVGVNVPNASLMIVENSERFGLAQLHQLRGRVGRGEYQSYCILKYQGNSQIIRERMKVISSTNDGFVISEKDLKLRGPGEFFGIRQHGLPELNIADLVKHVDVLEEVKEVALDILEEDPYLRDDENQVLRDRVQKMFGENIQLQL